MKDGVRLMFVAVGVGLEWLTATALELLPLLRVASRLVFVGLRRVAAELQIDLNEIRGLTVCVAEPQAVCKHGAGCRRSGWSWNPCFTSLIKDNGEPDQTFCQRADSSQLKVANVFLVCWDVNAV